MHRQIAGKLTGPVTKWIVPVRRDLLRAGHGTLNAQARRRPGQRGVVLAPRSTPSPPRSSTPSPRPSTPTTSRPSSSTTATAASPRTTSPPWTSKPPRSPRLDGVTDAGVLSPNAARRSNSCRSSCCPRTARPPTSTSSGTSATRAGTPYPMRPTTSATSRRSTASTVHLAGFGGQAADAAESFEGIDTNLILATLLRRDHHPAVHLPQPDPVVAADHLRRRRQLHRGRRRLPPGEVRRPDGQRAESGDPQHPGHRRRHRLRPAPGGPLSRRAPSARGPARGDGVRPAPRRPGDPGQRGHGLRRHAVPGRRRPQLDRRPRAGARVGIAVDLLLRHGHPASPACW